MEELAAAAAQHGASADTVRNDRHSANTKSNIKSGLNQIRKYLLSDETLKHHVGDNGDIAAPLPIEVAKAFFGYMESNKTSKDPHGLLSSYRSALKSHYVNKGVPKNELEKFDGFINPFLSGTCDRHYYYFYLFWSYAPSRHICSPPVLI